MDEKLFIVLNSKERMYNATTSSHLQVGLLAKMIFSAPGISMAVNWLKTLPDRQAGRQTEQCPTFCLSTDCTS